MLKSNMKATTGTKDASTGAKSNAKVIFKEDTTANNITLTKKSYNLNQGCTIR